MIKVLVVEDHPVYRQSVVDVLDGEDDIIVIGEAYDGETAIEFIATQNPDVVILDINIPLKNGLQVISETKRTGRYGVKTKFIVLTGYNDMSQAMFAFTGGASAYSGKEIAPSELRKCVRHVASGGHFVNGKIGTDEDVKAFCSNAVIRLQSTRERLNENTAENSMVALSPREMTVLMHVTYGLSNKEIATLLEISSQTVKNHMTAILTKMALGDRTQAAVYALRHGWIHVEESYMAPSAM